MKLTIVVPVYGVEKWILRCLESIGRQDLDGGIECLIVDDRGSDRSIERASDFIKSYTGPVSFQIITRESNGGLSAARNSGIEKASGEYIMFVDSDDFLETGSVEKVFRQFEDRNPDIIFYGVEDLKDGKRIDHFHSVRRPKNGTVCSPIDFLKRNEIIISSCFHIARTSLYQDLRFTTGVIHEDYAFMLRLYGKAKVVAFSDQTVYVYHLKSSGSITSDRSFAQSRRVHDSWVSEIKLLENWAESLEPKNSPFQKEARRAVAGFRYTALTQLLTRPLSKEEKLEYYRIYRRNGYFAYRRNRLTLRRAVSLGIYCLPFAYPLIIRVLDKLKPQKRSQ